MARLGAIFDVEYGGRDDMHLIAAALAHPPVKPLTRDRRLLRAAEALGIAA
jgi:hypothetical protein